MHRLNTNYKFNWNQIYGSPSKQKHSRIILRKPIVGAIFGSDDALAFLAVRNIITKIENDFVYYDIYSQGVKLHMSGKAELSYFDEPSDNYIVLEEQPSCVLNELG